MTVTVAALCGSFRQGSFNQALLDNAILRQPEGLEIFQVHEIERFPMYTQDVHPEPDAVATARTRVEAATGILLVTPEYNYGVPGYLKNAIDWLSRPPGNVTLWRRPVALMGASTGYMGTIRSQMAWRQTAVFFNAPVFAGADVTIAFANKSFDTRGQLVSEPDVEMLDTYLTKLRDWLESGPR